MCLGELAEMILGSHIHKLRTRMAILLRIAFYRPAPNQQSAGKQRQKEGNKAGLIIACGHRGAMNSQVTNHLLHEVFTNVFKFQNGVWKTWENCLKILFYIKQNNEMSKMLFRCFRVVSILP
jgi:hypothetical protein